MNDSTRKLRCEHLEDRRVLATLVGDAQIVETTCPLFQQEIPCETFLDIPVAVIEEVRILPAQMDLSKDARVSVMDLALLVSAYAREPVDIEPYDMNEDGRFSSKDFFEIFYAIANTTSRNVVAPNLDVVDAALNSFATSAAETFIPDTPFIVPEIAATIRQELVASSAFEFLRFDLVPARDDSQIGVEASFRDDNAELEARLKEIIDRLDDLPGDNDLSDIISRVARRDSTSTVLDFDMPYDANRVDEVLGDIDGLESIIAPYSAAAERLLPDHILRSLGPTIPIVEVQDDWIRIYSYDLRFLANLFTL